MVKSVLDDEFHILLLSNASADFYKDNTIAKFTNNLPYGVNLFDNNWCCGITEVFFHTFQIVFLNCFLIFSFCFELDCFSTMFS